jgi:hypothetical protein
LILIARLEPKTATQSTDAYPRFIASNKHAAGFSLWKQLFPLSYSANFVLVGWAIGNTEPVPDLSRCRSGAKLPHAGRLTESRGANRRHRGWSLFTAADHHWPEQSRLLCRVRRRAATAAAGGRTVSQRRMMSGNNTRPPFFGPFGFPLRPSSAAPAGTVAAAKRQPPARPKTLPKSATARSTVWTTRSTLRSRGLAFDVSFLAMCATLSTCHPVLEKAQAMRELHPASDILKLLRHPASSRATSSLTLASSHHQRPSFGACPSFASEPPGLDPLHSLLTPQLV